jgi:hypothetical protein
VIFCWKTIFERERKGADATENRPKNEIDQISVSHIAHNRKGFAAGAIQAAKFIINKKGIFNMNDLLSL